ncbi:hypothetical protein A3844_18930 [Paenibacillus helianthi]|uniref:YtkA-like domain-containing protein n=1 Tax=Paenibacillus helianthi TaxID=1349432 RepID=A0ABX3EJY4_9BACL|nr:FixH family protein [Paenibacillus helianthi]OKP84705.1 hypothetical protein A3844_18930 [Paenibacillus helianthi]
MIHQRKLAAFLSVMITVALSGCSGGGKTESHMHTVANMSMEPIKVELNWSPQQVTAGQKVTFEALVTQDGEPVNDAKEVLFEIRSNSNTDKKLEFTGESAGDGTYKAEGIVETAGEFTVTSHVTARTQHSMPSKKLVVQP